MELTAPQIKALTILSNTTYEKTTSARGFGEAMFTDYHGRKAWLCGGSYLAKLAKKGLIARKFGKIDRGYYITEKGKQLLNGSVHTSI